MNSNIKRHVSGIKINKDTANKFQRMMNLDDNTLAQFIALLELPDAIFDSIYPTYVENMKKISYSPEGQKQLLAQLRSYPYEDIEQLRAELPEFLKEIADEEDLSVNKKALINTIFSNTLDTIEELIEGGSREFIPVKIVKLNPDAVIPTYAHPTDCGADVSAVEDVTIDPGKTVIVKTGIAVAIPAGYEIQVRPRSGLSLKTGLRIANAPGTIDADYRGEIGIIMTNTDSFPFAIEKGTKIAQLVIAPTPRIKWEEVSSVDELGSTERGAGGYGSTSKS